MSDPLIAFVICSVFFVGFLAIAVGLAVLCPHHY